MLTCCSPAVTEPPRGLSEHPSCVRRTQLSNVVAYIVPRGEIVSDEPIVVAEALRKRFGDTQALDGLDLAVPAGTVCGVLGPNGAGKTTAVRILATLADADSGQARIAGY